MTNRNLCNLRNLWILFFITFLFSASANAQNKVRAYTSLTGGGTGALDKTQSSSLSDGDISIVVTDSVIYIYSYDDSSISSEDSPDIIVPDDAPTSGGHILIKSGLISPSERTGTATTNPFYRLYSSGGLNWYLNAIDEDGTLEINNAIGGQTRMKILGAEKLTTNESTAIYLITRDASGNIAIQHVTLGATDSGGSGYRCLRVPNSN